VYWLATVSVGPVGNAETIRSGPEGAFWTKTQNIACICGRLESVIIRRAGARHRPPWTIGCVCTEYLIGTLELGQEPAHVRYFGPVKFNVILPRFVGLRDTSSVPSCP
jgi:hypothetical protein